MNNLLAPEAWKAQQGWRAGSGRASNRDQRTLDIASFSGHGNEAILGYQKAHARALTSARSPTITTRMGSWVNHSYSELLFQV